MKKISLIIVAVLGIALLSFAITAPALAGELDLNSGGFGNSRGTQGGYGNSGALGTGLGIPVNQEIQLDGALEELLHTNIALGLGMDPVDLNIRLEAGETVSEIAQDLGFDLEAIREIISQAWEDALAEAVATGVLTQEQADWLASRNSRDLAANGLGICDESDCTMNATQAATQYQSFYRGQRRGMGQ